jgi:uncharacterized protein YdaU (DUF1376 family)
MLTTLGEVISIRVMRTRRPKIPDMPVERLIYHPKTVGLPPAAYGMLMRLAHHFWYTNKPLPTTDARLRALAQCHQPVWRTHKAAILDILAEVIPAMAKRRADKIALYERLSLQGRNGVGIVKAKAANLQRRLALEKSARAFTLPQRTQAKTAINVETRTERQSQKGFVETHF